jgi:hypothetical protein
MSLFIHNYFNVFKRTTHVTKVTTLDVEISSHSSARSNNSTDIILQSRSDDNSEMGACRRIVTFHPSVVTLVHERPSTPTEEKSNLYFSRQELQQYRNEEKAQMFEKDKLISVIKSQEKYQKKSRGFQQGSVTKVTFNLSFSHIE